MDKRPPIRSTQVRAESNNFLKCILYFQFIFGWFDDQNKLTRKHNTTNETLNMNLEAEHTLDIQEFFLWYRNCSTFKMHLFGQHQRNRFQSLASEQGDKTMEVSLRLTLCDQIRSTDVKTPPYNGHNNVNKFTMNPYSESLPQASELGNEADQKQKTSNNHDDEENSRKKKFARNNPWAKE